MKEHLAKKAHNDKKAFEAAQAKAKSNKKYADDMKVAKKKLAAAKAAEDAEEKNRKSDEKADKAAMKEEEGDIADSEALTDCGEGKCQTSDGKCKKTCKDKKDGCYYLAKDLFSCTKKFADKADDSDSDFKVDYGSNDWEKDYNADGSNKAD